MTRTKKHKQIFGTHPVPGQSRKFVYVYVFFLSPTSAPKRIPKDGVAQPCETIPFVTLLALQKAFVIFCRTPHLVGSFQALRCKEAEGEKKKPEKGKRKEKLGKRKQNLQPQFMWLQILGRFLL